MATKYGLIARRGEKWWTAWITDNPRHDPAERQPVVGAEGRFSANESDACASARSLLWQDGIPGREAAATILQEAGFTVELFEEPLGRGRPAKAAEHQRKHTGVYLSDTEHAAVEAAMQPGEDFSGFMREAARLLIAQRSR